MLGTYFFSDAELDEARFELRRRGAPIPVQPKAMRLLFYLVQHRHRVVSGDELLAELWRGETVCRGSLKRAVRLARRALGDDGARQARIRTVRTYGYQFVAQVAWSAVASIAPERLSVYLHEVATEPQARGAVTPRPRPPGARRRSHEPTADGVGCPTVVGCSPAPAC